MTANSGNGLYTEVPETKRVIRYYTSYTDYRPPAEEKYMLGITISLLILVPFILVIILF